MSERNDSNNISDKEHGDYTTIDLENCDIYEALQDMGTIWWPLR